MIKPSLTVFVAAMALAAASAPAFAQQAEQQQQGQPQDVQQQGPPPYAQQQQGQSQDAQQQGPPPYAQQQQGQPQDMQQQGPPPYGQQQQGQPQDMQQQQDRDEQPGAPPAGAPGAKQHHRNKLRQVLRGMDLSAQQQSQIKGYMQQFRTSHQGGGTPESRQQLMANIESSLTPDQRTQFENAMHGGTGNGQPAQQGSAPQ